MFVTPSPNRSRAPSFNDLDEDTFEEMACALHEKEPGVKNAELYRTNRKAQFGIDVIAERHDGCIEVASCKCYSKIKKGAIDQWSTDFLQHWDTQWKNKNVGRFILVVATLVNSKERDGDVQKQRKRFQEIGVTYDVWGPRQLQEKLRDHSGIVSQYMGPEWVSRICNDSPDQIATCPPKAGANNQSLLTEFELLQSALSEEIDKQLEVAVNVIRRGDLTKVAQELAAMRAGPNWRNLRPNTQARVIRLQGSLTLQRGDLLLAQLLSDEADTIAPPDEPRLQALLAARCMGPAEGLRVLGNPESRDGVQLKVVLMIEAGDHEEAFNLLSHHPALRESNAETERLKAFTELLRGRRSEALAAVRRAEGMEPLWPAVRRTGAIVRYALALSPLATSDIYLGLNPVALDLVREDDEGKSFLSEALSRFDKLIAEDANTDMRSQDEAWALACMSNFRDQLAEAEERCRDILRRTPANAVAVIWALARGFEIDTSLSTQALLDLVDHREADAQHVLVLAWLLAADDQLDQARRVLQDAATLFDTPRAQEIRDQWLVDHSADGAGTDSTDNLPGSSPSRQLTRAIERGQRTCDWSPVDRSFQDMMTMSTPPPYALAAARALASAGRWSAIGPHLNPLLRFDTAEAVRLAIYAAYKTGQMQRVIEISASHRSAFPGKVLPNELRAIEIDALQASGDPATALRKASMLAAESPALDNHLIRANVHLKMGNIRAALPIIRNAMRTSAIPPRTALHLAQSVEIEDPDLARQLWRQAKTAGIPDELAPLAISQAFRLNLEHETDQLFGVMQKLAQNGSDVVRLVSVDDLGEFLQRGHQDSARLQNLYYDGIVPGHLVADHTNFKLASRYWLSRDEHDPSSCCPTIMMRHGSRPFPGGSLAPITDWHIHLDITALMFASQLELLDQVERLPNPIAVSSSLPVALQQLETQIRPHQPGQVAGMRAVLAAIAKGAISVAQIPERNTAPEIHNEALDALRIAATTQAKTVIVVHELPNTDSKDQGRFSTIRAIVDGVYEAGELDSAGYQEALVKIGQYSHDHGGTSPNHGVSVLFLGNTFSVLAVAGLLDPVARVYRIQIGNELQVMARNEVAHAERNEAIASSLGRLRNRVAEGLESGRYKIFSSGQNGVGDENSVHDDDAEHATTGAAQSLYDFVRASSAPGVVVWADDRYISGYQNDSYGSPLIGVTDVLQALRQAQLISDEHYFKALLRLRINCAMFIPIETEEVCRHLAGARTINGVVVETPALATLRRYVAQSLLLDSHLKIGNLPQGLDGRPDETVFLIGLRALAERCINIQWKDDTLTEEIRRSRASWIWDALRVDGLLRVDLPGGDIDRNLLLSSLQICGLLTGAIDIVISLPEMAQRGQTYFKWVEDYVLGCRLENDQPLAEQVTRHLVSLLLGYVGEAATQEAHLQKLILRTLVAQFPGSIRKRLLADASFCKFLEFHVTTVVSVGDMSFNAHQLLKAVGKALAYGKSRLRTTEGGKHVSLRAVPGAEYSVCFNGNRTVLTDPVFALLDGSLPRRRAAMQKHLDWFDMPTPMREQTIQRVCEIRDAAERIDTLARIRDRSVDWHYKKVREQIGIRDEHSFKEFLPPSADALLDHLRLPSDMTELFVNRLDTAASALLTDYGSAAAFERLAGIPVDMPASLLQTLRAMSPTERKSVLAAISDDAKSPLQLLHVLFLLREVVEVTDREIFVATLDRMLNEWSTIAKLFVAVLKWTHSAYTLDSGWGQLPATDRLALVWTHADRLTDILLQTALDTDQVARDFDANHQPLPIHELLRLDPGYHSAAANPETIGPECLLFHGLGYVLNGCAADSVLSLAQVETVRTLLTMEVGGARVASIWLFANRDDANNDLGTFFTRRPDGLPLDVSLTAVSRTMDGVMRDLEADPLSPTAWASVSGLGKPALEPRSRARLLAILENIDLIAFVRRNPEDIYLCRTVVDCWSRLGDHASHAKIVAQIERLAAHMASLHPGALPGTFDEPASSDTERYLSHLVEATAMSARAANVTDAFTQLGDSLVSLAAAWPNSTPVLRQVLNSIGAQEPVLYTKTLWKPLLVLRTY